MAAVAQRGDLVGELALVGGDARRLVARGLDRGIGDAALGAHRGVAREQPGKRGLGLARPGLGGGEVGGDARGDRLGIGEPRVDRGALGVERGDGAAGILVERGLARGVGGEAGGETVELGQPPDDGVALGARGRQLVGEVAALVARDERGIAPRGERGGGLLLQALRGEHVGLEPRDVGFGGLRLVGRGARGAIGLGPARIDQPRLGKADLVAQFAVARRGAGLSPERGGAGFLVAHDLVEPLEIGLGRAQLLLGILAARVEPRDPRRFLEHQAALGRAARR